MKNIFIIFLSIIICGISLFAIFNGESNDNIKTEYLRIHIRANSNLEIDQNVKYKVKDAVIEYLTPYIAECDTESKAEKLLFDNLSGIKKVANNVLSENGFNYTSNVKVKTETFPTRTYQNLTLESGDYRALIIELGEGAGDNWWCVVYPPLCFVGSGNYIYASKIYEIIKNFTNSH